MKSIKNQASDRVADLQDTNFLETQRFGQSGLSSAAASQLVAAERTLYFLGKKRDGSARNPNTRQALMDQGKEALNQGMRNRKMALANALLRLGESDDQTMFPVPEIPNESVEILFQIFEDSQTYSDEALREHLNRVASIYSDYEALWGKVSALMVKELNALNT